MANKATSALGGAASGAAKGAALGSIVPGIGNVVGAIGGGLIGGLSSLFGGPSSEEKALEEQKAAWDQIKFLPPNERNIVLTKLKSMGQLTPEMEEDINQTDTQMQSIRLDPAYKAAQMAALNKLSQVGQEGGLTLEDRAVQADALRDIGVSNRGRQEAVLQNMAQRGQLGSGAELAARLSATDAAAERSNQIGMSSAANAQKRALEALMQSGQLAGSIRGQDYDEQAAAARAQDAINSFNVGGQRGTQQRNVGSMNDAQAANLREAQRIADYNASLSNKQKEDNKRNQIDYQSDLNKQILGKAGANVQAGQATDSRRAGQEKGVGDVLSGAAGMYQAYQNSEDEKKKKADLGGVVSAGISGLTKLLA